MRIPVLICAALIYASCSQSPSDKSSGPMLCIPSLEVNHSATHNVAKAFRIAMGDMAGNVQSHQSGLLTEKRPCLYAGLVYGKPWTRDAAINVWNGFGLLAPEIARNTLLAQLDLNGRSQPVIGGQYWDRIIWSLGAWQYCLYTGDRDFLKLALDATINTLDILEQEEFDSSTGLFRGPAVYGDGVAAYPVRYTRHQHPDSSGSYSGISQWPAANPDLKAAAGYGIPMQVLSTNCVYHRAYELLDSMALSLGRAPDAARAGRAGRLAEAINKQLWSRQKKSYIYFIDPQGECDAQEGLGLAFAILFDIADEDKKAALFQSTIVEPAGMPCVYPGFPRYRQKDQDAYGRHSGTVWPHVQGFWADAAARQRQYDIFLYEFRNLGSHALRDFQFVEIYHPRTGEPYGGLQEPMGSQEWFCAERQSWSASAYFRMILMDIAGLRFSERGIAFQPFLPPGIDDLVLSNLRYRDCMLTVHLSGCGHQIKSFSINGMQTPVHRLQADAEGAQIVDIVLEGPSVH